MNIQQQTLFIPTHNPEGLHWLDGKPTLILTQGIIVVNVEKEVGRVLKVNLFKVDLCKFYAEGSFTKIIVVRVSLGIELDGLENIII